MDCEKAQRLFDDLSQERLAPELAAEMRRHLTDCTDCRVLQQRDARLQRLLALKRYERPAPEYFDYFLTNFHKRLLAETQPRTGWRPRVSELWSAGQVLVWRYGFASAMGVALATGVMWMGLREMGDLGGGDQMVAVSSPLALRPVAESSPVNASLPLPDLSHLATAGYDTPTEENVVVPTAATRPEPSTPQYVLDRISVAPASYEVARVYF